MENLLPVDLVNIKQTLHYAGLPPLQILVLHAHLPLQFIVHGIQFAVDILGCINFFLCLIDVHFPLFSSFLHRPLVCVNWHPLPFDLLPHALPDPVLVGLPVGLEFLPQELPVSPHIPVFSHECRLLYDHAMECPIDIVQHVGLILVIPHCLLLMLGRIIKTSRHEPTDYEAVVKPPKFEEFDMALFAPV